MDERLIRPHLHLPGQGQLYVFEEIDSTNAFLIKLGRQGAPEWTIAVAERQTRGRGRLRRSWESPAGVGLWFSVLLRPDTTPAYSNLINLLAAVSLANFLEQQIEHRTGKQIPIALKWPNDLFIQEKKLCGILVQTNVTGNKVSFLILGIGLNVNHSLTHFSDEIRHSAISLKMATGCEWNREELLSRFLNHFHNQYRLYQEKGYDPILASYWEKVKFRGELVAVNLNREIVEGLFEGLTPQGFMILRCKDGRRIISSGEIVF